MMIDHLNMMLHKNSCLCRRRRRSPNTTAPGVSAREAVTLMSTSISFTGGVRWLSLIFLSAALPGVKGEASEFVYGDKHDPHQLDEVDGYVIVCMATVFAICVSGIGLLIGYYAVLEDAMIRRYQRRGQAVMGQVVALDNWRHLQADVNSPIDVCCGPLRPSRPPYNLDNSAPYNCNPQEQKNETENHKEYIVLVDYRHVHVDGTFKSLVRKRVKARDDDFIVLPSVEEAAAARLYAHHHSESSISQTEPAPAASMPRVELDTTALAASDQLLLGLSQASGNRGETPSPPAPTRMLELLALPEFPQSGLPRRQLDRSSTCGYRLPTFMLVLFTLLVASLCVTLAASMLPVLPTSIVEDYADEPVDDDQQQQQLEEDQYIAATAKAPSVWTVCLYCICVLAVELLMIHTCFNDVLKQSIRMQYLEGGDRIVIPADEDDGTLTTRSTTATGRHMDLLSEDYRAYSTDMSLSSAMSRTAGAFNQQISNLPGRPPRTTAFATKVLLDEEEDEDDHVVVDVEAGHEYVDVQMPPGSSSSFHPVSIQMSPIHTRLDESHPGLT